jgi:hypothetical protein
MVMNGELLNYLLSPSNLENLDAVLQKIAQHLSIALFIRHLTRW